MNINDVLDYVKHTPENTNPNVLSGMLNSLVADNADFTNLKGYKVEIKYWPEASIHSIDYTTSSGAVFANIDSGMGDAPDSVNDAVLVRFQTSGISNASGIVKKLDNTVIDLSTVESLPLSPVIPLSDIEITYSEE